MKNLTRLLVKTLKTKKNIKEKQKEEIHIKKVVKQTRKKGNSKKTKKIMDFIKKKKKPQK